jgi:hypothetical protein
MELDPAALASGTPIEVDCPGCGTRHIIDPAAMDAILARRRFRCTNCGERKRIKEVAGFMIEHDQLSPFCFRCQSQLDSS